MQCAVFVYSLQNSLLYQGPTNILGLLLTHTKNTFSDFLFWSTPKFNGIFLCKCFIMLFTYIFVSFSLSRSWECQVGTSRRTGLQHQHNPLRGAPLQSPLLLPPVSPLLSVPSHRQLFIEGQQNNLKYLINIYECIFFKHCLYSLLNVDAGTGSTSVRRLFSLFQSLTDAIRTQTWGETREEVEA